MEFNSDRFLALAGIPADKSEVLRESVEVITEVESTESTEEALVEAKVRAAIRTEIEAIVQEMQEKGDTAWLYRGMRQPRRSKAGQVTRGFFGLGFADVGE